MLWKEIKQSKAVAQDRAGRAISNRVFMEGLLNKVTLGQRPEWNKGVSWVDIWKKNISDWGNGKYKDLEAGP